MALYYISLSPETASVQGARIVFQLTYLFNPLLFTLFNDMRIGVAHHCYQHVKQQYWHQDHENQENRLA